MDTEVERLPRDALPVSVTPSGAPPIARPLEHTFTLLDRLFERIYSARYNPLQQSGPLAVALLLVATATGLWLLLFYRVGSPFDSVAGIAASPWLAGWARSLHRYASDGAVVAVVLHLARMAAEGRAHGPRVLAWVTGVVLLVLLLVSGWTGFVLVWDDQGRALALAGARLLGGLPLLRDVLSAPFLTPVAMPASFFFMNLFLHVAVPLGLLLGLWLHTLRLARVRWLPTRGLMIAAVALLTVLAVAAPPILGLAADGASLAPPKALDLFYVGWVLGLAELPGAVGLAGAVLLAGVLFFAPWYWRPSRTRAPLPSTTDPNRCEGCTQCEQDCPFGAISMVPGPRDGVVALVNADLCTSCGLCAGSCEQLLIGPPDRKPQTQLRLARQLRSAGPKAAVVVVHCHNAHHDLEPLRARAPVVPYAVACTGSLHPSAIENLLHHFAGVYVASCPPASCRMRDGARLTHARLGGQRPSRLDPTAGRIQVTSAGPGEAKILLAGFSELAGRLEIAKADTGAAQPPEAHDLGAKRRSLPRIALAVCVTLVLVAGLAVASSLPPPVTREPGSALRLIWRVATQNVEECRDRGPEELAKLPVHMRVARECTKTPITYALTVDVDGRRAVTQTVAPRGQRGDGIVLINQELRVAPGTHRVTARYAPADGHDALVLAYDGDVRFEAGHARVIGYQAAQRALVLHPAQE